MPPFKRWKNNDGDSAQPYSRGGYRGRGGGYRGGYRGGNAGEASEPVPSGPSVTIPVSFRYTSSIYMSNNSSWTKRRRSQ